MLWAPPSLPLIVNQPYTSVSMVHFHLQTSALAVLTARFALIFGLLERTVHRHLLSAGLLNAHTKRVSLKEGPPSSIMPSLVLEFEVLTVPHPAYLCAYPLNPLTTVFDTRLPYTLNKTARQLRTCPHY